MLKLYPDIGPAAPSLGWVPAPRYLLRRNRVLKSISRVTPRSVLEIGCGAGMLLQELREDGMQCTALETSENARTLAEKINAEIGADLVFHQEPQPDWSGRFDLLIAMEVLEHIQDDRSALNTWKTYVKPAGHILISVPAHMSKWNARDIWAGHIRRYEKTQLQKLFESSGLEVIALENYGFPLANLLEPISARQKAQSMDKSEKDLSPQESTHRSGIERQSESKLFPLLASSPGRMAMRFFVFLQNLVLTKDLGNGYLVLAKVPSE